jgi:hypothetical protein
MALLRAVAGRFRTTERDELEAELARRLLALKRSQPLGIRSWERYIAKFLFNKASKQANRNSIIGLRGQPLLLDLPAERQVAQRLAR